MKIMKINNKNKKKYLNLIFQFFNINQYQIKQTSAPLHSIVP